MNDMTPIEPAPLFAEIESPEQFPIKGCGELMPVVNAIAETVQVPVEVAWHAVLEAVTLSVQAKANWLNPYNIITPLVLYVLTGAETGDRKTGASRKANAGAVNYQATLRKRRIIEMQAYENKLSAYNAAKKKIETSKDDVLRMEVALNELGPAPMPPTQTQIIFEDATIQAIPAMMRGGQSSVIFSTQEGGVFSGGHSMKSENRIHSQATLNSNWDGGPIGGNRVSNNAEPLHNRRMSVALMFQPDLLMQFIGDKQAINQGFFARFLIALPTTIAGSRPPRRPQEQDLRIIDEFNRRTEYLLDQPLTFHKDTAELDLRNIKMSEDAEELFFEFAEYCETNLAKGAPLYPIRDFANKAAENAGRIAGIMALFEDEQAQEISYNHTLNAINLMQWYLSETLRLRDAAPVSAELREAQELLNYIEDKTKGRTTRDIRFNDLLKYGPNKFRNADTLNRVVEHLIKNQRLKQTAQRPRTLELI